MTEPPYPHRMRSRLPILAIGTMLVVTACSSSGSGIVVGPPREVPPTSTTIPSDLPPLEGLTTEPIASGLSEPVAVAAAPGIDDMFIVERTGRIVSAASEGRTPVLDLTSVIGWEINEQGLLGFAVHPDFPGDPRGFAVYTNADLDVVVSSVEWNGSVFDASSLTTVLEVPQPHKYHQGGGIRFGPAGYLWMSFGDGGGVGDPFANGQNPNTLNGTIVRIDVDAGDPYAIPPDNPFIDSENGADEVWAYGLRNPWRFSFDDGWILIADVGQEAAEEIDVVPIAEGGHDFGWPVLEGNECFDAEGCDDDGMTPAALILPHEGLCAVIGGPVYRGSAIPELYGQYVFGDYCTGWIRSLPFAAGTLGEDGLLGSTTDRMGDLGSVGSITSIDTDQNGELVLTTLEGDVVRVVAER